MLTFSFIAQAEDFIPLNVPNYSTAQDKLCDQAKKLESHKGLLINLVGLQKMKVDKVAQESTWDSFYCTLTLEESKGSRVFSLSQKNCDKFFTKVTKANYLKQSKGLGPIEVKAYGKHACEIIYKL